MGFSRIFFIWWMLVALSVRIVTGRGCARAAWMAASSALLTVFKGCIVACQANYDVLLGVRYVDSCTYVASLFAAISVGKGCLGKSEGALPYN
jgi:hypothetical protein